MRKGSILFGAILFSLWSHGQSPIWQELKSKYPDESGIFQYRDKVITLEVVADSLNARAEIKENILFLKDRPDNASDMRIFGSRFQEIEDVKAKTQVWEKSKYKDIPLTGLTRKREDDSNIFFDDSYFYHLSFPVAHAGNQATWSYKERYQDVRFIGSYYFQDYLPQVKGSLILRVPKGVEIKWDIINDPSKLIQFKQYEKSSYTHYEWSVEDIPAIKWETKSPKYACIVPHVVFRVATWKTSSGSKPVLSNLDDLHRWYYSNLKPADEVPTELVTNVVKQLIQPGDTEMDIVQKVFYWVQSNIRYIAFEDGMRGFIPHKPSYVMEKRYGDCKDMASLIVGMLKAAGVETYYTWIGTRDLPYRYAEHPSPLVDNHMIATYIDSNKNYFFLDGTSNHTSVQLPSSMIQGKEAFIALGATSYEIKVVPEMSADKSGAIDTVQLKIETNSLLGKGKTYLTGYQKIDASYDFNKTQAVIQKENITRWLQKGSNKFLLNAYKVVNLDENDRPLILDYDFRVSDYVTYADAEIYVNLNLEKFYYNQFVPAQRKMPSVNEFRHHIENYYVMEIPAGYEVEYLPPNAHFKNSVMAFDISYKQSGSSIIYTSKLVTDYLLLSPEKFSEWNSVIKELSNAYKESVIFKRKS